MIKEIPGMTEEQTLRFVEVMEALVEHGYGQMVLVINAGKVDLMLPAPSIRTASEDLPPFILYRQNRKGRHGS